MCRLNATTATSAASKYGTFGIFTACIPPLKRTWEAMIARIPSTIRPAKIHGVPSCAGVSAGTPVLVPPPVLPPVLPPLLPPVLLPELLPSVLPPELLPPVSPPVLPPVLPPLSGSGTGTTGGGGTGGRCPAACPPNKRQSPSSRALCRVMRSLSLRFIRFVRSKSRRFSGRRFRFRLSEAQDRHRALSGLVIAGVRLPIVVPGLEDVAHVAPLPAQGQPPVRQQGLEDDCVPGQRVPAVQALAHRAGSAEEIPEVHPGHAPHGERGSRPHARVVPAEVGRDVRHALEQAADLRRRRLGRGLSGTHLVHQRERLVVDRPPLRERSAQEGGVGRSARLLEDARVLGLDVLEIDVGGELGADEEGDDPDAEPGVPELGVAEGDEGAADDRVEIGDVLVEELVQELELLDVEVVLPEGLEELPGEQVHGRRR